MFMNANHGISSTTTAKISVRRLGRASRLPKTHSPLDEYACPCGGKRGHEYNFATRRDKESPHTVYRHALGYFCLCFASVCVGDDRSWVVAGSWRHPRRNAFSFHSYLTYLFRSPPPSVAPCSLRLPPPPALSTPSRPRHVSPIPVSSPQHALSQRSGARTAGSHGFCAGLTSRGRRARPPRPSSPPSSSTPPSSGSSLESSPSSGPSSPPSTSPGPIYPQRGEPSFCFERGCGSRDEGKWA